MAYDKKPSISLKGDSLVWKGMTRLTEQVDADLRWRLLKNCYVSEDGTEIRSFPGWLPIYEPNYASHSYAGGSTLKHFHGYKFFSGGALVIFAEDDRTTEGTASSGTDADSLVAIYIFTRGNISTAVTTISQAWEVANRYVKTHGSWWRDQAVLPFKGKMEVLPDRIIMSVPGYSCVFQAFLGALSVGALNGQAAYTPRSLGVPKAVINSTDTGEMASTTSPLGAGLGVGTHYIRIAYRDDITGEVGLASEVYDLTVSTNTPPQALKLVAPMSGEIMPECFSLSVMVYASRLNGNKEFMGLVAESGMGAGGTAGDQSSGRGHTIINNLQWVDGDIDFTTPPPIFEQMPVGCKAIQTVRGFTFFGGFHGDYGHDGESYLGTLDHNANTAVDNLMSDVNPADIAKQFGLAGYNIPPGYSGARMGSTALFSSRKSFRLDKLVNKDASVGAPPVGINYEVVTYPKGGRGSGDSLTELMPDRGVVRYSEEAAPGVVPAINRIFVDAPEGEDVEALGKIGNALVICTKTKTFGLAWGRTPTGSDPVTLHNELGCIAPDSMVEFDGGLAWLSARGPVAMASGGPSWVGIDLKDFFVGPNKRYKVDSRGMMYHSFARHDPDRALVYFGVRRDTHNTNFADNILTVDSYTIWTDRQIRINCSAVHGLRVGAIVYLEGITTDALDVFLNGFHRVMAIPDTDTFTIVADVGYSQSSPVVLTPTSGAKCYKNGAMSKVACDELLVWSYKQNAWSIVEIPDGMEMISMERIPLTDGEWRMTFMTTNGKIYALDDASVDTLANTLVDTHTLTDGEGTDITFTDTTASASMRVGMNYFIIRTGELGDGTDATDEGVVSRGTITAIASNVITISDSYDRKTGDIVYVGALPMELESNFISLSGGVQDAGCLKAVTIRNTWTSKAPGLGLTERIECDHESDGTIADYANETGSFQSIAPSKLISRLNLGNARGRDTKVTLKFHGIEQFAVKDVELEVGSA